MCRFRYLPLIVLTLFALGCDGAPATSSRLAKTSAVESSGNVDVWRHDFEAALSEAEHDAKPLLIFFTADWCSYCDQMRAELAKSSAFGKAAQGFVCVEVDGLRHVDLAAEHRVTAYPTWVLSAPHGAALQRLVGVQTPETIVAQMNATVTVVAGKQPVSVSR